MTAAGSDHQGDRRLTDSERRRLADLDTQFERDDPDLARLARGDRADPVRWARIRASWFVSSDRNTRWIIIFSSVFLLFVDLEMFLAALRGGNLPGLLVTLMVFAAAAWLLTRPAALSSAPPPG